MTTLSTTLAIVLAVATNVRDAATPSIAKAEPLKWISCPTTIENTQTIFRAHDFNDSRLDQISRTV